MRILKTLLIIVVYELSKYVTNEIITCRQANDAVDQYPKDYELDSDKLDTIVKEDNRNLNSFMFNVGGNTNGR